MYIISQWAAKSRTFTSTVFVEDLSALYRKICGPNKQHDLRVDENITQPQRDFWKPCNLTQIITTSKFCIGCYYTPVFIDLDDTKTLQYHYRSNPTALLNLFPRNSTTAIIDHGSANVCTQYENNTITCIVRVRVTGVCHQDVTRLPFPRLLKPRARKKKKWSSLPPQKTAKKQQNKTNKNQQQNQRKKPTSGKNNNSPATAVAHPPPGSWHQAPTAPVAAPPPTFPSLPVPVTATSRPLWRALEQAPTPPADPRSAPRGSAVTGRFYEYPFRQNNCIG